MPRRQPVVRTRESRRHSLAVKKSADLLRHLMREDARMLGQYSPAHGIEMRKKLCIKRIQKAKNHLVLKHGQDIRDGCMSKTGFLRIKKCVSPSVLAECLAELKYHFEMEEEAGRNVWESIDQSHGQVEQAILEIRVEDGKPMVVSQHSDMAVTNALFELVMAMFPDIPEAKIILLRTKEGIIEFEDCVLHADPDFETTERLLNLPPTQQNVFLEVPLQEEMALDLGYKMTKTNGQVTTRKRECHNRKKPCRVTTKLGEMIALNWDMFHRTAAPGVIVSRGEGVVTLESPTTSNYRLHFTLARDQTLIDSHNVTVFGR